MDCPGRKLLTTFEKHDSKAPLSLRKHKCVFDIGTSAFQVLRGSASTASTKFVTELHRWVSLIHSMAINIAHIVFDSLFHE